MLSFLQKRLNFASHSLHQLDSEMKMAESVRKEKQENPLPTTTHLHALASFFLVSRWN